MLLPFVVFIILQTHVWKHQWHDEISTATSLVPHCWRSNRWQSFTQELLLKCFHTCGEGVRELGRFHCDVNRYILAALVFYVCFEDGAKWQGATSPLLQRQTSRGGSGCGATKKATELHPKSLRATCLSAPLWGSHTLVSTCLWQSRSLVTPPLLDPSLFFRLPSTLHPQKLRKHSGIPIHPRMIEWAWTRRKGSCDEREKEKRVCTHVPFCAFSYHPSCLPRPCPHNRVLTEAVSRQH